MGLKKENYEIRGRVLPEAYAVVRRTETNEYNKGSAFIGIAETRELALRNPLEEILIQFDITNRDINDRKLAYLSATQPYKKTALNEKGEKVEIEIEPILFGWEDDYAETSAEPPFEL